ncbi:MAG: hypothetical protein PHW04_10345 [Candidatus Wallbacteria bacterium]|nr:hypothetical protein [Candidatus Wallbacteria bacterium]
MKHSPGKFYLQAYFLFILACTTVFAADNNPAGNSPQQIKHQQIISETKMILTTALCNPAFQQMDMQAVKPMLTRTMSWFEQIREIYLVNNEFKGIALSYMTSENTILVNEDIGRLNEANSVYLNVMKYAETDYYISEERGSQDDPHVYIGTQIRNKLYQLVGVMVLKVDLKEIPVKPAKIVTTCDIKLAAKSLLKDDSFSDLALKADGEMIYLASNQGVQVLHGEKMSRVYSSSDGLSSEAVTFVEESGDNIFGGTFSLAGRSCLFRINSSGELKTWLEKDGAPRNVMRALPLSSDLLLCATFQDGLFLFDLLKNKTTPVLKEKFSGKMLVDILMMQSKFFLASRYDGLYEITGDDLTKIFSTEAGPDKIDKSLLVQTLDEHSSKIQSNQTTCMSAAGNDLWIGTRGGASLMNGNNWVNYWEQLPEYLVTAICPDGDYIWFGTPSGLSIFNKVKNKWWSFGMRNGLPCNRISRIKSTRDSILVVTEQGAVRIEKKTLYSQL